MYDKHILNCYTMYFFCFNTKLKISVVLARSLTYTQEKTYIFSISLSSKTIIKSNKLSEVANSKSWHSQIFGDYKSSQINNVHFNKSVNKTFLTFLVNLTSSLDPIYKKKKYKIY